MIFLFQRCILRFHVNLPGCIYLYTIQCGEGENKQISCNLKDLQHAFPTPGRKIHHYTSIDPCTWSKNPENLKLFGEKKKLAPFLPKETHLESVPWHVAVKKPGLQGGIISTGFEKTRFPKTCNVMGRFMPFMPTCDFWAHLYKSEGNWSSHIFGVDFLKDLAMKMWVMLCFHVLRIKNREKLRDYSIFENPLGIKSSHFSGGKTIQVLLHIAAYMFKNVSGRAL